MIDSLKQHVEIISLIISICSLIVAITVALWGNNLLGRMTTRVDKVETQTKEIEERVKRILSPPVNQPMSSLPNRGREIIQFSVPSAFRCGVELEWDDLQNWNSFVDRRICSNENVYRVEGIIVGYESGMRLAAEMYVPEADRWYPSSDGGMVIPDNNGKFSADFCLQAPGPERIFRFKVIQNNRSISECRIHINRI